METTKSFLERRIVDQLSIIEKDRIREAEQIAAAENFLKSFPKGWTLDILEYDRDYNIYGEYLNPDNPLECDFKREVLWSKIEKFRKARIVNKEKNYIIDVYLDGKKAYLDPTLISYNFRRKYTRAKQILKNIAIFEKQKESKLKASEQLEKTTLEIKEKLISMFPNATIEMNILNKSSKNYTSYDTYFTITFKNGCSMKCYYDSAANLHIDKINIPSLENEKDPLKKMQILNNLNF